MTRVADQNLVFLDVETSHLVPALSGIVEIAYQLRSPWSKGFELLRSYHRRFDLTPEAMRCASAQALEVNGYNERTQSYGFPMLEEWCEMLEPTRGAILVGSNPPFDRAHLDAQTDRFYWRGNRQEAIWSTELWSHRVVDLACFGHVVASECGLETSGLHGVYTELGGPPLPEHRADADVERAVFVYRSFRFLFTQAVVWQSGPAADAREDFEGDET